MRPRDRAGGSRAGDGTGTDRAADATCKIDWGAAGPGPERQSVANRV